MNTPNEQSEQDTTEIGIGIGIGPKKRSVPFPNRPPCAMPLDAEDGDGFRLDYDLLDGPDDEVTR